MKPIAATLRPPALPTFSPSVLPPRYSVRPSAFPAGPASMRPRPLPSMRPSMRAVPRITVRPSARPSRLPGARRRSGFWASQRRWVRGVGAAALLSLASCSSVFYQGVRTYRPLVLSSRVAAPDVFSAARATAQDSRWREVRVDERRMAIDAVLDSDGVNRDHVQLRVNANGNLRVTLLTEVWDGERWAPPEYVCDGYSWSRERAVAQLVLARARRDATTAP